MVILKGIPPSFAQLSHLAYALLINKETLPRFAEIGLVDVFLTGARRDSS